MRKAAVLSTLPRETIIGRRRASRQNVTKTPSQVGTTKRAAFRRRSEAISKGEGLHVARRDEGIRQHKKRRIWSPLGVKLPNRMPGREKREPVRGGCWFKENEPTLDSKGKERRRGGARRYLKQTRQLGRKGVSGGPQQKGTGFFTCGIPRKWKGGGVASRKNRKQQGEFQRPAHQRPKDNESKQRSGDER